MVIILPGLCCGVVVFVGDLGDTGVEGLRGTIRVFELLVGRREGRFVSFSLGLGPLVFFNPIANAGAVGFGVGAAFLIEITGEDC